MSKHLISRLICGASLLVAAPVLAQEDDTDCSQDSDCGPGFRCEKPFGLVSSMCFDPEGGCPAEETPPDAPTSGYCVSERLGQDCTTDADCGGELFCMENNAVIDCPADDPGCADDIVLSDFCAFELPDGTVLEVTTLAAASGPAAGGGAVADDLGGAAGSGASGEPEIATASDSNAPEAPEDGTSKKSSSSCSVSDASSGHAATLGFIALSILALRRRRGLFDRYSDEHFG